MRRHHSAVYRLISFLVACALLATGCMVSKPTSAQREAMRQHERSLVLMRLLVSTNQSVEGKKPLDTGMVLWRVGDPDGLSEGPGLKYRAPVKAPSRKARDEGWRYVLVSPGDYYLRLDPERDQLQVESDLATYYLTVPSNAPVIYAGSLYFHQFNRAFTNQFGEPDQRIVIDELGAAKALLQEAAPGFEVTPGARTNLIPYADPRWIVPGAGGARIDSVEATSGTDVNVTGDHKTPASWLFIPGVVVLAIGASAAGAGGNGEAVLYVLGAGVGLLIAAVPLAIPVYGLTAAVHEKKWAPYEHSLRRQIADAKLEERIAEKIRLHLATNTTTAAETNAARYTLQVHPYRAYLRGDDEQVFTLEVGLQVKLIAQETGGVVWRHYFAHTLRRDGWAPYETWIVRSGPTTVSTTDTNVLGGIAPSLLEARGVYPLESYGGEEGAKVLQAELEVAAEGLSREVVRRLKAAGF